MKKYSVRGTTVVTVTKEVWANSEQEAYEKAWNKLDCLTQFCGNGGTDKLIGVYGYDESVSAYDTINYDDIEELEDDPDYFECLGCDEECDACESDDGTQYWHCPHCGAYYDEDGEEFYPDDDEDDE